MVFQNEGIVSKVWQLNSYYHFSLHINGLSTHNPKIDVPSNEYLHNGANYTLQMVSAQPVKSTKRPRSTIETRLGLLPIPMLIPITMKAAPG